MPVSTLIGVEQLTASDLASFALEADRERRAAIRRGDLAGAAEHDREAARLAALSVAKSRGY